MLKRLLPACAALVAAAALAASDDNVSASNPASAPAAETAGTQPAGGSCINFARAATFKTIDKDTIRLTVTGAGDFEVDLGGPQCGALDEAKGLAIQSAPSFPVCPGLQNGKHRLKFSAEGRSEPLRCTIEAVRAVPATPTK